MASPVQDSIPTNESSSGPLPESQSQPEPQTQTFLNANEDVDVDATVDAEMDLGTTNENTQSQPQTQQDSSGTTAVDTLGLNTSQLDGPEDLGEDGVRGPQKKDASLREFLSKMDDYAPIIPDAVTTHYLLTSGLPAPPTTPLPLARLLALATQKFIADIAADAYQYSRIRNSTSSSANNPLASTIPTAGAAGAGGGAADKEKKGQAGTAHLGVQRAGYGGGGAGGGSKTVLTMEDLGMAVGEYGVSVRRGEFYR